MMINNKSKVKLICLINIFSVILMLLACNLSFSQDNKEIKIRSEEISIEAGKFSVKGDLLMPEAGTNFPCVIFCTGSGPTNRKQTIEKSKVIRKFIEKGFAFFIDDKPGSGDSKGEFSGDSLLRERAFILEKEVEVLKKHPGINPGQIGIYGSSQASYVMSVFFEKQNDVSFLIAWSCPAMNSIEQSAYLVMKQTLCEGHGQSEADKVRKYFIQRNEAKTYPEYLEAAEYLDKQPMIINLGWGGVIRENDFSPGTPESESYLNPVNGLGKIKIPALFLFAEMDTQIDPVQGAEAFNKALNEAGNNNFKIKTISKADHNMRITNTGCLKEQQEAYKKEGGSKLSPEFLETISMWLDELKFK